MSESEPIQFRLRGSSKAERTAQVSQQTAQVARGSQATFDRQELGTILSLYGRKVAAGEWRDYAIDLGMEKAVFSVFRRASECPLFRIEKSPRLARKQGAYAVVAATGLILKRGHDLKRVLGVLEDRVRVVTT